MPEMRTSFLGLLVDVAFVLVDEDGAVARIPAKTVIDIYITRLGKKVASYEGKMWFLSPAGERREEKKPGRPKWVPGPNQPWKRFVINPKKG